VTSGAREFSLYSQRRAPRRWLGPAFTAVVLYTSLAASLMLLPERLLPAPLQHQLDVTFVQKIVGPEPPAPPSTATDEQPSAAAPQVLPTPVPPAVPAAAAPVVRPKQKVRQPATPPPLKRMQAPREIPAEMPKEAEPSEDKGVAVAGKPGRGDPAGLEGGMARGGVVGGAIGGVMDMPDDAIPPKLVTGNAMPEYPHEARAARRTGLVVLKVIVYADGTVGDVRVLEGEEPFVSAAVRAVKAWRYAPARYKGQPIAVYRTIRIPFQLSG